MNLKISFPGRGLDVISISTNNNKEMNKIKLKGLSDKRYAMSDLVGDAYRLNSNKISILAATVELLAKGTQHQKDAEEIIKGCYPQYYND